MHTPPQLISLFALLVVVTIQSGCIALSIPSKRVHDPTDRGGFFGEWKDSIDEVGSSPAQLAHSLSQYSIDGGPLEECEHQEPSFDEKEPPKKDEIPWPRFHPIPTRPVFGGAAVP